MKFTFRTPGPNHSTKKTFINPQKSTKIIHIVLEGSESNDRKRKSRESLQFSSFVINHSTPRVSETILVNDFYKSLRDDFSDKSFYFPKNRSATLTLLLFLGMVNKNFDVEAIKDLTVLFRSLLMPYSLTFRYNLMFFVSYRWSKNNLINFVLSYNPKQY